MSCHDIGRGMNSVVRVTMGLYDTGKIDKESAHKIIYACARGVYWCDGNEGEATEYIRNCVCGKCMNKISKGDKLYSIYDVSPDVPNRFHIDDNYELVTSRLCEECFDVLINEHCGDELAGQRERQYIVEHCKPEKYLSSGQYEEWNNGLPWN